MKVIALLLLAVIHQISALDVFNYAPNYAEGLQKAEADGKPIMIVILKSTCSACKDLKTDLDLNLAAVQKIADKFVIVQNTDKTETAINNICLNPGQGGYYPRICFMRANKTFLNVKSPNAPKWTAYYANAEQLLRGMSDALKLF